MRRRRNLKTGDYEECSAREKQKTSGKNLPVLIEKHPHNKDAFGYGNLLRPKGWLAVITDYIAQCSVFTHPIFSLAAAISLIGYLVGGRITGPTGLSTNFYNIIIGLSGSGKEAPLSSIKRLLDQFVDPRFQAIDAITSDIAILRNMRFFGPNMLLAFDEMGDVFSQANSRGSMASRILTLLKQLFSKTSSSYRRQYATYGSTFNIRRPHLNVLGITTPDEIYSSFNSSAFTGGFGPRCLFFQSFHKPLEPNLNVKFDGTKELAGVLTNFPRIGFDNMPFQVPESMDAEECREYFLMKCRDKVYEHSGDRIKSAIYSRMGEHGLKLSLIHAVSRFDKWGTMDIQITHTDCEWGFGLAEACVNMLADSAPNFTGADQYQRKVGKVYQMIREHQANTGEPINARDLQQNLHMRVYELNNIIDTLVQAEQVAVEEIPNQNKTITRLYRIIG